jgi:hypothetical protein
MQAQLHCANLTFVLSTLRCPLRRLVAQARIHLVCNLRLQKKRNSGKWREVKDFTNGSPKAWLLVYMAALVCVDRTSLHLIFMFDCRHQKGNRLPFVWWVQKRAPGWNEATGRYQRVAAWRSWYSKKSTVEVRGKGESSSFRRSLR